MILARRSRAGTAARALAVLGAAAVVGLAWSSGLPSTAGTAPPVDLGPYALADTGLLGLPAAPPPPSNVRAEPHDRSALVTWDAARPNTSTVRGYRVYVDGVQRGPELPASRRSTTVLGLTNYQPQRIAVRTVDSDPRESGDSDGASVTPFDDVAPSPVTGLVATRGDGRVTLTWESESATESDRAGVRVYVDGSLRTSLPAATTRYEATGLSNDVEHTFYLVAFDARPSGYGPPGSVAPNASAPSATVRATPTDLTPPSAPTAFTAVRGDATAALSWTAPPESDVGLYKVVDETGALVASFTAPATSGTATALTNGRTHRLRLVAVDTHGNHSPASAEVTVTPATPPVARARLAATPGDGRVDLAWDPRTADPAHAAAVELRVSVDGALVATLPGTATSYGATGLTNGRAYAFSVVGVDDQGRPGPAATVTATPLDTTAPSAPTGLTAVRGDATAALTWTAPPEGDVSRYDVVDADGAVVATVPAPTTSVTVAGLVNGTPVTHRVRAVDAAGNVSVVSAAVTVTPLAPPVAVAGLALTMDGDVPVLTWAAPVSPAPTGHEVALDVVVHRVGTGGAPDTAVSAPLPAGTTTYRVTGLAPGEAASFFLTARDGDPRESPRSDVVSTRLRAPTGVSPSPGDSSATISWTAVPGADGGYRVERLDAAGAVVASQATAATSAARSLTVTGLTNGTTYRFRVVALPASGQQSPPSLEVTVTAGRAPAPVGTPGGGSASSGVVVTRDGRHALLETRSSASDARPALVLADLFAGTRTTVAQQPSGPGGDQTFKSGTKIASVALSGDGRQIAVATTVAVDAARDRNGAMDVYRYDVATTSWTLVSAPRGGGTGTATGVPGSLSTTDPTARPQVAVSDAGDVFFTSERTDLVAGAKGLNVFVQRLDGSIALASDPAARPLQPSRVGGGPASFAVTPDGSALVYVTGERRAAGTDLVRVGATGSTVLSVPTDKDLGHRSGQVAVSDDGGRAVYSTSTGSTGGGSVSVRLATLDPSSGVAGVTTVGTSAQALSQVGIAPDGSAVFFSSAQALLAPDDKGSVDVFRTLPDGTGLQRVTQPVPGPRVDSVRLGSYGPVRPLSADAVLVVTLSALVTGDTNAASDAYLVGPGPGEAHPVVGAP